MAERTEKPTLICVTGCGWEGPEDDLSVGELIGTEFVNKYCPQCGRLFGNFRIDGMEFVAARNGAGTFYYRGGKCTGRGTER